VQNTVSILFNGFFGALFYICSTHEEKYGILDIKLSKVGRPASISEFGDILLQFSTLS
jgi:hypothetical protein